MPCLEKCCYCINLKAGCYIIGFLHLILILINASVELTTKGFLLIWRINEVRATKLIVIIYIVVEASRLLLIIIFIVLVHLEKAALAVVYCLYFLITISENIAFLVVVTIDAFDVVGEFAVILSLTVPTFFFLLDLYCLIVVCSYKKSM